MDPARLSEFIAALERAIGGGTFVKLTLGKGVTDELTQAFVRPVEIQKRPHASILFRHKTKDVTANHPIAEAPAVVRALLETRFRNAHLFTTEADVELLTNKKGESRVSTHAPTFREKLPESHNREKRYVLDPRHAPYLAALGLVGEGGQVKSQKADKYRQLQNIIKLLDGIAAKSELVARPRLTVVDMGAGKGYLTFALYDYCNNHLGIPTEVVGVDQNDELVQNGNRVAKELGYAGLRFVNSTVEALALPRIDLLVALHACDTATDDAIFKGMVAGAAIVMVVPCCQKELRPQFKAPPEEQPLFKHDTFKDRFAQTLTDGLRALLMESRGYRTRVIEFISDAHTHRNVMIVGVHDSAFAAGDERRAQIGALKARYGIQTQKLESLLEA